MAAYIKIRNRKHYTERMAINDKHYKELFRFQKESVELLYQTFLEETRETRDEALSTRQKIEIFYDEYSLIVKPGSLFPKRSG